MVDIGEGGGEYTMGVGGVVIIGGGDLTYLYDGGDNDDLTEDCEVVKC